MRIQYGYGFADSHFVYLVRCQGGEEIGCGLTATFFIKVTEVYETYFKHDSSLMMSNLLSPTTCRDTFFKRRTAQLWEAGSNGPAAIQKVAPLMSKWVCDPRMLRVAWDRMARRVGKSPGPNGRRYSDFSDDEVWNLLSIIGKAIQNGHYQPGPTRLHLIPKDRSDPSRGTRRLTMLNIEDRTVQRLIVDLLQPLLDPLFGTTILGFRPGRDRVDAMALAYKVSESEQRYAWIAEDIKNAFDNVPRSTLMEVIAKYVPSSEIVDLVRRFVDIDGKKRGIPQGGPLSPLLLNLYVYHFLEKVWAKHSHPDVPLVRVADDILLLCCTPAEAQATWILLHKLMGNAGLPLKHGFQRSFVDLSSGNSADWLGYRTWKGKSGLETKISTRSWHRLKGQLELAHEKPDSSLRAIETINGWVDQLGPCYAQVKHIRVCRKIEKIATECGFKEIPNREAIRFCWLQAGLRWKKLLTNKSDNDPNVNPVVINNLEDSFEAPTDGMSVDAAWNHKTCVMEYRGIWIHSGKVAFELGPFQSGSNNLGEFLAIVHALRYLKRKGIDCPIYSDSQTAITWVQNQRVTSRPARFGLLSQDVYSRMTRLLKWLSRNPQTNPIVKWDTETWGEIPADYGRK